MTTPAPDLMARIAALLTVTTDLTAPIGLREDARRTATDLMARHDIEPAAARAACGTGPQRLTIDDHPVSNVDGHGQARASLVIGIAIALDCKGVHQPAPAPKAYHAILLGRAADVRAARRLAWQTFHKIHSAIDPGDPQLPDFIIGYGRRVAEAIARPRVFITPDELHHRGRLHALLTARFPRLNTITVESRTDWLIAGRAAADRDAVRELRPTEEARPNRAPTEAGHTPDSGEDGNPPSDDR
ncbi:hypothetical protein ABZ671_32435 [Micromonospora sp. NPDC006766]|uniref:hypothetical protein n=1 Tax=Micromonospora sp. NPDC006766 TaxID=3154778 RepID=UPI00340F493E